MMNNNCCQGHSHQSPEHNNSITDQCCKDVNALESVQCHHGGGEVPTNRCGENDFTEISRIEVMNRLGRAMADPTRSRILLILLEQPHYPADIAKQLGLSRTNVSNHLSCLRGCGIIVATLEGRRSLYEIADPHITDALQRLLNVTLRVDNSIECSDPDCCVCACCKSERGE